MWLLLKVVLCVALFVDTLGGISTEEEMCLAYFLYYPRLPASKCWGAVSNLEELGGLPIMVCNEEFGTFEIPDITTEYVEVSQCACAQTSSDKKCFAS